MLSLVLLSLNILSFWTYGLTNFLKVGGKISPPIRHFRFSIFLLETLELEWQCSQYLEFNPTCVNCTERYEWNSDSLHQPNSKQSPRLRVHNGARSKVSSMINSSRSRISQRRRQAKGEVSTYYLAKISWELLENEANWVERGNTSKICLCRSATD